MTADADAGAVPNEDLMAHAAAGDRDAFSELVRRHQQPLFSFFCRMGVYSDAEDLVQETFVRLYKYRKRYQPSAKFQTFLYVVARRLCIDRARRAGRRQEAFEALQYERRQDEESGAAAQGSAVDVEYALSRLPAEMREVVVLSQLQGLKYQQIADIQKVPVGTVKSRMFHALRRLRDELSE